MPVGVGISSGSLLPSTVQTNQTGSGTQVSNQTGSQNATNMNQYSPQQQALQGQAGGSIANILAGGSPSPNFGLPQSVYDAAWANFNQNQAPMLAAQNGAGSPAIGSAMQNLNVQLAGLAGQRAMPQALDAIGVASNLGFNSLGNMTTDNRLANGTQADNSQANTSQTFTDWGNILAALGIGLSGL